jgi:hypothetical protein
MDSQGRANRVGAAHMYMQPRREGRAHENRVGEKEAVPKKRRERAKLDKKEVYPE